MIDIIELEIQIPPSFQEKYREALIRSADLCAVKRHLENPPQFIAFTKVIES
jgi:ribosomal protein S12 methylthiotransferase accessory factor